jgi:hypothetical protein
MEFCKRIPQACDGVLLVREQRDVAHRTHWHAFVSLRKHCASDFGARRVEADDAPPNGCEFSTAHLACQSSNGCTP